MTQALWTPSAERIASSSLSRFVQDLGRPELTVGDYATLHHWSIDNPTEFWTAVWDSTGIIGERRGPVVSGRGMPGTRFFPKARLNFAENLLERGQDDDIAVLFRGEDGRKQTLTRGQLKDQTGRMASFLAERGLEPGDRVAAMMPNRPETLVAMLATTALGGIWSSCSPDFGAAGILDRFGQIKPKFLIACTDYRYGGKHFDCRDKISAILAALPSLQRCVVTDEDLEMPPHAEICNWDEVLQRPAAPIQYLRFPFNHPLYILFSSGTTGAPKCILHGAGGTLIQHLKEHVLQADVRPGDRMLYFTTCGWMMWNWLVSALAAEATIMLFDGAPFHPDGNTLFDFSDQAQCSFFGVSAKYVEALRNADLRPRNTHKLESLRTVASTGSPLAPESFQYIYDSIKSDVAVQSISGGTDIVSCFVLGNPWKPVYAGEIQGKALGMAVEVWEDGAPAPVGTKADLVCTRPFPSMPLGFWQDERDERYRSAYFNVYPGVWHHGDFAEETIHGGLIIHGRSDATLNPGGIRIGTAEIYRQVEQIDSVLESLAVGQAWEGDVRIVLFVVLRGGVTLDSELQQLIRQRIREGASPRHIPAKIIQIPDLPRTRSGKLAELAVRSIIQGEPVKNRNALANPEALDLFPELQELRTA